MSLFQSFIKTRPTVAVRPKPNQSLDEAQPLLRPLTMLQPRAKSLAVKGPWELATPGAAFYEPSQSSAGVVWKCDPDASTHDERLLNLRHFAILGLQTQLRRLVPEEAGTSTLPLRLFLSSQTDHAYVDYETYRRMAFDAVEVLGVPGDFPVFLDVRRECMVVDTSRFFEGDSVRITAAAVHGIAVMIESPRFLAYLEEQPRLLGTIPEAQQPACRLLLQAASRCIVRWVLDEPQLQVSQLAQQLAARAHAEVVARALLTGTPGDTHTAATIFVKLWHARRGAELRSRGG